MGYSTMIKVNYTVSSSRYLIQKKLKDLATRPVLSFDTETKGVYPKSERKEAQQLLDKTPDLTPEELKLYRMVAGNNGLSFPSLVTTTHFIFGTARDHSEIIICNDPATELMVWRWVAAYKGLLLIHNTLFDLKIMFNRVGCFPQNYEDSALLAKCYINHVNIWKAKTGLKEIMGAHYDPSWSIMDDYEPEDLRDPKFLKYASIDGAATFHLWEDLQEYREQL